MGGKKYEPSGPHTVLLSVNSQPALFPYNRLKVRGTMNRQLIDNEIIAHSPISVFDFENPEWNTMNPA